MMINELKSLLSRFHLKPNKFLGQNFLLSETVLDQIVEAAELKPTDRVLEIGPGLGFLTRKLAEKAGKVVAVEKDRRMVKALKKIVSKYQNVEIIEGDILFLPDSRFQIPDLRFKVVANIPYYLTGKVIQKFLTLPEKPSLMVLLLQKEVAERIVAKPGKMSILSVSVQFYSDPEIIAYVSKENFYPVPEVDSAIVRFTPPLFPPLEKGGIEGGFRPRFNIDEKKFFQLVKIGFANKRKQLKNNLQAHASSVERQRGAWRQTSDASREPIRAAPPYNIKRILADIGLNSQARAQDLSLEDWVRLYLLAKREKWKCEALTLPSERRKHKV